jgi:hypothetical protein
MKQILTLIVAVLCTATLMAGNITPEAAKQIAKQQLRVHSGTTRSLQAEPKLVYTSNGAVTTDQAEALTKEAAYYVFNGDAGYVVIAGDDRQTELLGYSDSGTFPEEGNIPENMKSWLDFYAKEYKMVQNTAESSYYNEFQTRTDNYKQSVSPLLGDIQWNQNAPYSNSCPLDDGTRSATGCVATAMAQIMKYHNYPEKGTGSISYTTTTKKLSVNCNFSNLTFDWDNMLPTYTTGNYNTTQANAVATLMFACGAAVNMDYTNVESAASYYEVAGAFRDYFSYDKSTTFMMRSWFTNAQWLSYVKGELSNGRPVFYTGNGADDSGHAFVFDGYDANDYVHANWGWSGSFNGYFQITSLNPVAVGTGGGNGMVSGFNIGQTMICGISKSGLNQELLTDFVIESMETSRSSVSLGAAFNVTIYDLYNLGGTFSGKLGLLLVDSNKKVTTLGSLNFSPPVEFFRGIDKYTFEGVKIPASTAAGTYTLCVGLLKSGGSTWTLANSDIGYDGKIKVIIANSKATFTDYYGELGLRVSDYSLGDNIYTGVINDISMTFSNPTRNDVYTTLGFGITSVTTGKRYNLSIGAVEMTDEESTKTLSYKFAIPDSLGTGKFTIAPLAEWGGTLVEIGDAKTIEVEPVTKDVSLVKFITYPTTDKSVYAPGETVNISCKVGLSDNTTSYLDTWYWIVYPYSGGRNVGYTSNSVLIEKGTEPTLEVSYTQNLSDGKYFIVPYNNDDDPTQLLSDIYCPVFTISSQATGIDDTSAEANSLIVYPQPVEETLNMRSPAEAQSVDIYDISGRRVVSQSLGGGRSHSVGVGSLTAGTYIINVNCGGKIYKEKFVKR